MRSQRHWRDGISRLAILFGSSRFPISSKLLLMRSPLVFSLCDEPDSLISCQLLCDEVNKCDMEHFDERFLSYLFVVTRCTCCNRPSFVCWDREGFSLWSLLDMTVLI